MTEANERAARSFKIEFAIIAVKDAAILYERYTQAGTKAMAARALKALHKAQNDLYDAIGGMEEYKFDLED